MSDKFNIGGKPSDNDLAPENRLKEPDFLSKAWDRLKQSVDDPTEGMHLLAELQAIRNAIEISNQPKDFRSDIFPISIYLLETFASSFTVVESKIGFYIRLYSITLSTLYPTLFQFQDSNNQRMEYHVQSCETKTITFLNGLDLPNSSLLNVITSTVCGIAISVYQKTIVVTGEYRKYLPTK